MNSGRFYLNLTLFVQIKFLFELDSVRANQIHKNNKDKVIRSIEMCKGLNMPISQYKREQKEPLCANWYMPKIKRDELYERINKRVDLMLEMGLFEEWQKNKELYPNSKILENTIGYRIQSVTGNFLNLSKAFGKILIRQLRKLNKEQETLQKDNLLIFAQTLI